MRKYRKPAAILAGAARLLEKRQWVQRMFSVDRDGNPPVDPFDESAFGYCLVGAIYCVSINHICSSVAQRKLRETLEWPGSLYEWNDQPSRTKAQVVRILRKAAEEAASQAARKLSIV